MLDSELVVFDNQVLQVISTVQALDRSDGVACEIYLRVSGIEHFHLAPKIHLLNLFQQALLHAIPTNFHTFCALGKLGGTLLSGEPENASLWFSVFDGLRSVIIF